MFEEETIPCVRCGTETMMLATKLCNNCWEVDTRIEEYLQFPKNRQHVENVLKNTLSEACKYDSNERNTQRLNTKFEKELPLELTGVRVIYATTNNTNVSYPKPTVKVFTSCKGPNVAGTTGLCANFHVTDLQNPYVDYLAFVASNFKHIGIIDRVEFSKQLPHPTYDVYTGPISALFCEQNSIDKWVKTIKEK